MKWKSISARKLRPLLLAGLLAFGACGDEDNSVSVQTPNDNDENQSEEGGTTVPTGQTIIVNANIDNDVEVENRTKVEDDDFVIDFDCANVDQVIHRQFIHISVRCPSVPADDTNQDGILDEVEVQQVVGPGVLALDNNLETEAEAGFPTGTGYTYQERLPLSDLHQFVPPGQQFAFIIYGVSENEVLPPTYQKVSDDPDHLTVPIFCQVLTSPAEVSGGTTGGTGGGTTGGITGGTAGGSGGSSGGTGGSSGGTGGSSGGSGGSSGGTGGSSGGTGGTDGSSGGTSGGSTGGTDGGSSGGSGGTTGGSM